MSLLYPTKGIQNYKISILRAGFGQTSMYKWVAAKAKETSLTQVAFLDLFTISVALAGVRQHLEPSAIAMKFKILRGTKGNSYLTDSSSICRFIHDFGRPCRRWATSRDFHCSHIPFFSFSTPVI